jgi:hypothetical protein
MKKLITVAMSAFLAFNGFASTLDVKPIRGLRAGDAYVRVTKLENNRIKFEKCVSGLESKSCENLGRKSSYTIKELQSQRSEEQREVAYAVGADVGLVIAAAVGGVYAGAALGGTIISMAPAALGVNLTFLVGTGSMATGIASLETGTAVLIAKADVLNPLEQSRQAKTLNEDVINDNDVQIAKADMNDFIERLDLVLSKI